MFFVVAVCFLLLFYKCISSVLYPSFRFVRNRLIICPSSGDSSLIVWAVLFSFWPRGGDRNNYTNPFFFVFSSRSITCMRSTLCTCSFSLFFFQPVVLKCTPTAWCAALLANQRAWLLIWPNRNERGGKRVTNRRTEIRVCRNRGWDPMCWRVAWCFMCVHVK